MKTLDRLAVHFLLRHRRAAVRAVMLEEARAIHVQWRDRLGEVRTDARELDAMRKEIERIASRAGAWRP